MGFAVVSAATFLGCVDTGPLFTEMDTDPSAADVPADPAPPSLDEPALAPSAGSPDMTGGAGAGSAPGASEAGPPLTRVDPPPPPNADAPDTDSAIPSEPVDPAPPAPTEPEPPPPPAPSDDANPVAEARVCRELTQPLLLDFEQVDSADQAFFGDFQSTFSGGTFVYPVRATDEAAGSGLVSDVTGGDWRVSGVVDAPAGLGLFFDCQSLDASRFDAIAFRIQGEIEGTSQVTFVVGSAANDVSREWLLEQGELAAAPSFGRCTPAQAQFDGSCQAARITLPITAEPSEVIVPFAALGGGSPEPGSNPAEITTLQWSLPAPPAGAEPYSVELRIDDIRFVTAE